MRALTIGAACSLPLLGAHAAVLSAEQLASLRAKLAKAQEDRTALSGRVACFTSYVAEQQARSDEQQRALEVVLRRRDELANAIAQGTERQRGFEGLVNAERANVESKRQAYERARSEWAAQDRRLADCRRFLPDLIPGLPGICKIGESAVKGLGLMRDAEADLRAETQRLQGAESGLRQAGAQLDQNRSALSQAQADAAANRRSVQDIEGQISRAKKASEITTVKISDYDSLIIRVASTVDDAGAVDPDDARLREVDRLVGELDAFSSGMPGFITAADQDLPDDAKQKCSR